MKDIFLAFSELAGQLSYVVESFSFTDHREPLMIEHITGGWPRFVAREKSILQMDIILKTPLVKAWRQDGCDYINAIRNILGRIYLFTLFKRYFVDYDKSNHGLFHVEFFLNPWLFYPIQSVGCMFELGKEA